MAMTVWNFGNQAITQGRTSAIIPLATSHIRHDSGSIWTMDGLVFYTKLHDSLCIIIIDGSYSDKL